MGKKLVGKITHYYNNAMVAVVKVEDVIKIGDKIEIEGHENSFEQTIDSMQIDKKPIKEAKKGQEIGLKVDQPVKENYKIYKV